MRIRKLIIVTSLFGLLIIGCKDNRTNQQNQVSKSDSPKVNNSKIDTSAIKKSNYELLQGKWQSENDKTNFLVFNKYQRKEIAEGMDKWDVEEFVLSDYCQNVSNKLDTFSREKDNYISCKQSDLCWYIMSLTEDKLTLQYLGRGNTLIYNRFKE